MRSSSPAASARTTPPAAPRWLRDAAGWGCNWTKRSMRAARAGSAPRHRACQCGWFPRMRSAWSRITHRRFWGSVSARRHPMKADVHKAEEEQPKLKGKEYEKQLQKLQVEL